MPSLAKVEDIESYATTGFVISSQHSPGKQDLKPQLSTAEDSAAGTDRGT